ncbi:Excinuclease ABC subunit C [Chitinophaga terrae (ex Kim and Jung 2007)]|uniref:UvrABC system protein C n=1 Tax=Chitinophaga terrae (ex Kim and Jung 2007) TaxID=408074 RepID=A0A1H4F9Q6_9BACT|nr:excinuclease ABC subunit UvrC [Chitinophaga terrae (ex Kim and Jung 2007)]MDQ0105064.1 excinuclease ABC subunit C [Chitinophaga terrae (ex Kim and Jung 2007)]GEP92286.1 UvrABC system protein C [Chitinophaga terrae (ex Kim and Jung 2007)]SEA94045.1 Excinuclease ABC subunit C [Chitinophaga terrae (ex Kim and Jung 2007)]
MTGAEFQNISHTIPLEAGIYKYYDKNGTLLYVGKAKSLRKRVSSYFVKNHDNYKTRKLVEHIHHIEFTIVNSEQDAFLLENSLIKQFKPKYNIELKDDKSYPYIVIKHENFPRVFLTRNVIKDGSEYLGPFTSVGKVRELLDIIKYNIPLRTCNLNLSPENIKKGKFKVCLEYHLGNCKGPCEGLQTEEDYREGLQQVRNILKGNLSPIVNLFKEQMMEHVSKMEFEKAEIMKKKIASLETYSAKSTIVNTRMGNVDVFSIISEGNHAYVNYLRILNGTVADTKTVTLEKQLEETDEEVMVYAIAYLRDVFKSITTEIIVPFPISYPESNITVTVPKGGDKKKLLELSEKNVNYFKEELYRKKILHLEGKSDFERKQVLYQLQADLELPVLPEHIECFDNSNFQGSYPVAACVVFKDGVASKKDYRHFNIKTVEGINDFASMKEIVFRRYNRLLAEQQPLPQLVIIDGGKGQLGAAMESIRQLDLIGSMTVVGLAKNEEEIFFPGDSESIKLPYNSESLKLIRRVRDEVHRFGITFHRQKRSKGTFKNELESIKGIGQNTATQLLKTFRSVARIKLLSEEDLTKEVGPAKAALIYQHFHKS